MCKLFIIIVRYINFIYLNSLSIVGKTQAISNCLKLHMPPKKVVQHSPSRTTRSNAKIEQQKSKPLARSLQKQPENDPKPNKNKKVVTAVEKEPVVAQKKEQEKSKNKVQTARRSARKIESQKQTTPTKQSKDNKKQHLTKTTEPSKEQKKQEVSKQKNKKQQAKEKEEPKKKQEPKKEIPKKAQPKKNEQPKKQELKKEAQKKQEPKRQSSRKIQSKKQQPKKEQAKKETPKKEQAKKETAMKEQLKKEQLKKQNPKQEEMKKVVSNGKVPVDEHFSRRAHFKVYQDQNGSYSATLNQSNIAGNNNKFYIIQLLVHVQSPKDLVLHTRWGRVGVTGQYAQAPHSDSMKAVKQYHKKFNQKIKGGYRLVQMNYEVQDKKQEEVQPKDQPSSDLPSNVQDLVKLIFDMKMMNNQMMQIGYDAKKMPLGKLAKSSISKGYEILNNLMVQIKGQNNKQSIKTLSSNFYSQIPHNFGFANMLNFILDTEKKVKEKLQMLQTLEDIQVFTKLLDQNAEHSNQIDSNYAKLNINIKPLDKKSPTYELLLKYVTNTHAKTHTAYSLQVLDIFQVDKQIDRKRYRSDIGNKMLLWHGSRLTNFVGILSQGLRIAPPEAPVTGYMFGKGVYFADMVTKSANYCFTNKNSNIGLMLLCEVAMGDMNEKYYADYYANLLPEGKNSTKGCGKTAPKEGEMLGDVLVPCGEGISTGIDSTSLLYNQFIVYDVAQIKTRFLFKMKFNHK